MRVTFFTSVATLIAVIGPARSRAVNISNTWMLPEEGFPVFYRYFRDRISWNEADAVCQFHHANLVTVDTTLQYDAIRAYLKELDISSNVWIGLSRSAEKPNFVWRDFHELSVLEHHWQEAMPIGNNPLCGAMDPAADFRWHALNCGGPDVASFICELPVPSWAIGQHGCLITDLPSLTVLFIPEQSALELTSDCGLDGTRRVVCKGNRERDELMKLLSCTEDLRDDNGKTSPTSNHTEIESSSPANIGTVTFTLRTPTTTTKSWLLTSNTIDTGDYSSPARQRRETEDISLSGRTTPQTPSLNPVPSATAALVTDEKDDQPLDTVTTSAGSANGDESSTIAASSEPEEFASAINQGQLFSIIADGALFDIIELNTTDENATLDVKLTTTAASTSISGEYTTVHYHKEPTERVDTMLTDRKTAPLAATTAKISKEELPGYQGTIADDFQLNRTFRKKVPEMKTDARVNLDVDNDIKIDDELSGDGSKNETFVIVAKVAGIVKDVLQKMREKSAHLPIVNKSRQFATAQRANDKNVDNPAKTKLTSSAIHKSAKWDGLDAGKTIQVPFTLQVLMLLDNQTNEANKLIAAAPSEQHAPEATVADVHRDQAVTGKGEDFESEPTLKPNRQRMLTRSNRRSFYPYFFSRVLG